MSRTVYKLKVIRTSNFSPTETVIGGIPYIPDDKDEVKTYSEEHRDVLIQHGYELIKAESEADAAAAPVVLGPIDVEELGKSELNDALRQRGVVLPGDMSRSALVETATKWNATRFPEQAAATQATASATSAPAGDTTKPHSIATTPVDELRARLTGKETAADIKALPYGDLKGFLSMNNVAFPGNASKESLHNAVDALFAVPEVV